MQTRFNGTQLAIERPTDLRTVSTYWSEKIAQVASEQKNGCCVIVSFSFMVRGKRTFWDKIFPEDPSTERIVGTSRDVPRKYTTSAVLEITLKTIFKNVPALCLEITEKETEVITTLIGTNVEAITFEAEKTSEEKGCRYFISIPLIDVNTVTFNYIAA